MLVAVGLFREGGFKFVARMYSAESGRIVWILFSYAFFIQLHFFSTE